MSYSLAVRTLLLGVSIGAIAGWAENPREAREPARPQTSQRAFEVYVPQVLTFDVDHGRVVVIPTDRRIVLFNVDARNLDPKSDYRFGVAFTGTPHTTFLNLEVNTGGRLRQHIAVPGQEGNILAWSVMPEKAVCRGDAIIVIERREGERLVKVAESEPFFCRYPPESAADHRE